MINIDEILYDYYVENKSTTEIAIKNNVSRWTITDRIKKTGRDLRSKTCRLSRKKYHLDETILDKIDVTTAWIIGWFLSDGFIIKDNVFGLVVSRKDKDVLDSIKTIFKYDGPIKEYENYLKKTNKKYKVSQFKSNSRKIVGKLKSFGVKNKKSQKEKFPKVISETKDENIIRSFIKGFFEGDGSLLFYPKKNTFTFQIVGTSEVLKAIQNYLIYYLGLKKTKLTRYKKSKNHYALRYAGRFQALKIADWLYCDPTLKLNRKYNKYLELKKYVEEKCKA